MLSCSSQQSLRMTSQSACRWAAGMLCSDSYQPWLGQGGMAWQPGSWSADGQPGWQAGRGSCAVLEPHCSRGGGGVHTPSTRRCLSPLAPRRSARSTAWCTSLLSWACCSCTTWTRPPRCTATASAPTPSSWQLPATARAASWPSTGVDRWGARGCGASCGKSRAVGAVDRRTGQLCRGQGQEAQLSRARLCQAEALLGAPPSAPAASQSSRTAQPLGAQPSSAHPEPAHRGVGATSWVDC